MDVNLVSGITIKTLMKMIRRVSTIIIPISKGFNWLCRYFNLVCRGYETGGIMIVGPLNVGILIVTQMRMIVEYIFVLEVCFFRCPKQQKTIPIEKYVG